MKPKPSELKKIPLFETLDEKSLGQVVSCLNEKQFQKGETITHERESCERIFIVKSGRVRLFRTAPSGREQTLATLSVGETCACNPGVRDWYCSSTAEALTPTSVWFFSRDKYVSLVQQNAQMALAISRVFANRICSLSSLVEEVSLKDVKRRLVKFLLDMVEAAQRRGEKEVLNLPFTREEMANRLGASRETISRQLSALQKSGFIRLEQHGVLLLQKEALVQMLE